MGWGESRNKERKKRKNKIATYVCIIEVVGARANPIRS